MRLQHSNTRLCPLCAAKIALGETKSSVKESHESALRTRERKTAARKTIVQREIDHAIYWMSEFPERGGGAVPEVFDELIRQTRGQLLIKGEIFNIIAERVDDSAMLKALGSRAKPYMSYRLTLKKEGDLSGVLS